MLDGQEIRGPITPLGNFVLVRTKDTLSATGGGILLPDQVRFVYGILSGGDSIFRFFCGRTATFIHLFNVPFILILCLGNLWNTNRTTWLTHDNHISKPK